MYVGMGNHKPEQSYSGLGLVSLIAATGEGSVIPGVGNVVGFAVGGVFQIASLFQGLFKNHSDFSAVLAPILYREAQRTGLTVYAFWFGELLGVTAQGQIVHAGRFANYQEAMPSLSGEYLFYGENDNLSYPYTGGHFVRHGAILSGLGGGSGIGMLALGALAWFLFK